MENLILAETTRHPKIEFRTDGMLKIEGKLLPENADELFSPIFRWIDECTIERITFLLNLVYFNTAASKMLFEMLAKTSRHNIIAEVTVQWMYEIDDEDSYDTGLMFQEDLPEIKFEFHEYAEI